MNRPNTVGAPPPDNLGPRHDRNFKPAGVRTRAFARRSARGTPAWFPPIDAVAGPPGRRNGFL